MICEFNKEKLDLSNFNNETINDMSYLFSRCKSLININLSNFNTQNVKDIRYMFTRCNSLIIKNNFLLFKIK